MRQRLVGQHPARQQRPVGGRHGVDPPGGDQRLADYRLRAGLVAADEHGQAGALPVQAHVLGAGGGDDHLRQAGHQQAQAGGVLLQAISQALVGDIDKRGKALALGHIGYNPPLLQGQIRPAGVVAAAVQQHHVAGHRALQVRHHALEIHPVAGGIVVAIGLEAQAHTAQQRKVHRPGGVAYPDPGGGRGAIDHLRADAQGAAAAGGLHAAHPPLARGGTVLPQHQPLHALYEVRIAGRRHVGLGGFLLHQLPLGATYGLKHGAQALLIHVDAYRQVHLAGIGVCPAGRGQAENGIGGQPFELIQHGVCSV